MRNRRTGCMLMGLGFFLALLAGVIVFMTVNDANAKAANAQPETKTPVLVAAAAIPERAKIDATMVKVVSLPVSVLPADALTKPEQAINWLALTPLYPGQPIVKSQVVTTTKEGSLASAALEPGKVLVAINFSGASNILTAGAIRRGDTVDLIVKVQGPAGAAIATAMQNLKVYEIGTVAQPSQAAGAGGAAVASPVFIFVVTPEEALELKFLETMSPDLILRAALDREQSPDPRPVIDYIYIAEKYGLPIRPEMAGLAGLAPAVPTTPGGQR